MKVGKYRFVEYIIEIEQPGKLDAVKLEHFSVTTDRDEAATLEAVQSKLESIRSNPEVTRVEAYKQETIINREMI